MHEFYPSELIVRLRQLCVHRYAPTYMEWLSVPTGAFQPQRLYWIFQRATLCASTQTSVTVVAPSMQSQTGTGRGSLRMAVKW
eukprot:COSAG02_NODE_8300_length_2625_cov_1.673397_4_plen_83_part_00